MPPTEERRPRRQGGAQQDGESAASIAGTCDRLSRQPAEHAEPAWIRALSDAALAKLSKQLDAAVRPHDLPSVEIGDVLTAAAMARYALRRRRQRARVDAARTALVEAGWSE